MIPIKPLFDAIAMEDGQRGECLAKLAGTNENNRGEIFRRVSDILEQLVAPEARAAREVVPQVPERKFKARAPQYSKSLTWFEPRQLSLFVR